MFLHQIAMTLMSSSFQSMEKKNMIDHHYDSLKCAISSVDKNSELFSNLNDYVQKTHGKTHTAYTLDVQEVSLIKRRMARRTPLILSMFRR